MEIQATPLGQATPSTKIVSFGANRNHQQSEGFAGHLGRGATPLELIPVYPISIHFPNIIPSLYTQYIPNISHSISILDAFSSHLRLHQLHPTSEDFLSISPQFHLPHQGGAAANHQCIAGSC